MNWSRHGWFGRQQHVVRQLLQQYTPQCQMWMSNVKSVFDTRHGGVHQIICCIHGCNGWVVTTRHDNKDGVCHQWCNCCPIRRHVTWDDSTCLPKVSTSSNWQSTSKNREVGVIHQIIIRLMLNKEHPPAKSCVHLYSCHGLDAAILAYVKQLVRAVIHILVPMMLNASSVILQDLFQDATWFWYWFCLG